MSNMLLGGALLAVGLILAILLFPVGAVIGVPLFFWGLKQFGVNIKTPKV